MLDTTTDDYLSYLEFEDPTLVSGDIPKTRPNDLNLASISFSKFAGSDSTTRYFKSIDSTATRWTVSFTACPASTPRSRRASSSRSSRGRPSR